MPTTTISIRVDKDIKEQADALFDELGLSLTSAINVFLRQSVRRRKIPFEIESEYRPNEKTQQAIINSYNQPAKIYNNLQDLFADMEREIQDV